MNSIKINLIGTGGNGSWLVPMLSKLAETENIKVTLWDDDIIEEKNIRNQNFQFIKIGKPKAVVLAEYYNHICKPKHLFTYKTEKYDLNTVTDIVITAVDNDATRLDIAKSKNWNYWLDCGVNPEMSYAALNTQSSSPSTRIFIVPPNQQTPACTEFRNPVQNIIAASSTFLLLDAVINNHKLEIPFITHTKNNGISTVADDKKGYPFTWTSSFLPILDTSLDNQLTLSWFLHWLAVQNQRTTNPGRISFKRDTLNLNSKISNPDIANILKTYWSQSINHIENSSNLGYEKILIGNNITIKKLSCVHNLSRYYPIIINSNSKKAEIQSLDFNCDYKLATSEYSKLSNDHRIFNRTSCNEMPNEKLNIFDTIRINLSVFILALQFQEGFLNKHQVEWFDTSKCITRKIKLTEDTLRKLT
jgi:hypothetical protein